jgi:hypothetical protein
LVHGSFVFVAAAAGPAYISVGPAGWSGKPGVVVVDGVVEGVGEGDVVGGAGT